MRNIRLTLAYDGTNYVGWQIQPNGVSVQSVVETAIEKLTLEKVSLIAAGRTDSGVHALGQVANFPTATTIPCVKLQRGLQSFLPEDVIVRRVEEVDASFHATYSAIRKQYRYVIHNSPVADPFLRRYTYHYRGPLDALAMHTAAQELLGKHDFRCFESHFPNKATSVRTIEDISVQRCSGWPVWQSQCDMPQSEMSRSEMPQADEGEFICLNITADGFLYNMVRAITGTLLKTGRQIWTAADVKRIVENQDRSQAGETAPPQGLYLLRVDYDA